MKHILFLYGWSWPDLKSHPWTSQSDIICVKATVLPSMRKGQVYNAIIIMRQSNALDITAYCTCPAGLPEEKTKSMTFTLITYISVLPQ